MDTENFLEMLCFKFLLSRMSGSDPKDVMQSLKFCHIDIYIFPSEETIEKYENKIQIHSIINDSIDLNHASTIACPLVDAAL